MLPNSPPNPRRVRFCLDANISYLVADVIDPAVADIVHVSRVEALSTTSSGRSNAPDEAVARWCAADERVLVTCDDDFRGRTARTAGLAESGLEVIVFSAQLSGLQNQIDTISRRVTSWQDQLGGLPYGPRIWIQYSRGALRLQR